LIVSLDKLAAAGSLSVGGKAWNLGRLAQNGERVPPCFGIEVGESQRFAEFAGTTDLLIQDKDPMLLSRSVLRRYEELYRSYERLYEIMEAGVRIVPELRDVGLAIRSSASFEDATESSSAGQHDTFLGINGIDSAVWAIAMCWASQWTERAISYRRSRRLNGSKAAMGVVVQQVLMSDKSGVLFTQDPTRTDRCLLIEAIRGLGESLVSGQVIPERIRINSNSGLPIEKVLAPGVTELLSEAETEALAQAGIRIEATFGQPQDIEWAFVGPRLYILQTRPITGRATQLGRLAPS